MTLKAAMRITVFVYLYIDLRNTIFHIGRIWTLTGSLFMLLYWFSFYTIMHITNRVTMQLD